MPFTCTHPSAQTYRKSAEMDQNINRWTRKCRVRMHAILIAIDAETQALMSTAAPQALRHGRLLHMLLAALHSMLSPQRTTCGTVTPGTPSKPRFKGYVASTTYAATHKHTHTHAFCTHATSILACTNTHYLQLSAKCMQLPIHSYYSYESYSQRPRRRAPRPRAAAAHLGGTGDRAYVCSGTMHVQRHLAPVQPGPRPPRPPPVPRYPQAGRRSTTSLNQHCTNAAHDDRHVVAGPPSYRNRSDACARAFRVIVFICTVLRMHGRSCRSG